MAVVLASVTACGSDPRPEEARTATTADRTTGGPPASSPTAPDTDTTDTTDTSDMTGPPLGADAPVVDGTGAVLLAPPDQAPAPIPLPQGDPCTVLVPAGNGIECGVTGAGDQRLMWTVEPLPGTPGRRVTVLRLADGLATPTLVVDDDGTQFAAVTAVPGDIDGRPGDELVVGFRSQGSSAYLDLDVVGGDGTVVAHRSLDKGRAEPATDGVRTWSARFGPDDDNCCPSAYQAEQLVFDGTRWRLAPSVLVDADQAPAGAFP
jgi:hypothetical protein